MTTKADFNAEEWSKVVEAPLLAGMRVVAADRGGSIRESVAVAQVYAKARQESGESELLNELVGSPPAIDRQNVPQAGELAAVSGERLREALGILEQHATPEEIEAYKGFVLRVADAAARAHKEGGFVGIGGKQVSEAEQAALDDIAATLGTSTAG